MNKKNVFLFVIYLFIISIPANAIEKLSSLSIDSTRRVIVRLSNGDVISGFVIEYIGATESGEGIKLKTLLGTAIIYSKEIVDITTEDDFYRHNHRIFLLPTAEPIGSNHYIGDFEMLFLYGGFGIYDIASVTAGRSIIPGLPSSDQLSELNAKITVYDSDIPEVARRLTLAVGTNLAFINSRNRLIHYYGTATVSMFRSSLTASVFYKGGSQDVYRLRFSQNDLTMVYPDGSFGIGLGLDTKLTKRHDIHIIGELWNSDVTRPTNTGVLLGIRLCNTNISADFGFAFFTQPFIAPFASFVWTPF